MKLLTVGQSLRGITNNPSPYKITEQHLLPKFALVGRAVSLAPAKVSLAKTVPIHVPIRSAARSLSISTATIKAVGAASVAKAAAAKADPRPAPVAGEATGWRKFFSFASRSPVRVRRPWVQGEMTLETLKVVRNDLSEADLEVVTARPVPAAEVAPLKSETPMTTSVWGRVAAQFSSVTRVWL